MSVGVIGIYLDGTFEFLLRALTSNDLLDGVFIWR